jgi:hypothetical protein
MIPVPLDCRKPFPPYDNKHVPLQRALISGSIELIQTVDATIGTPCWCAG